jgi:hypothetical protein
MTKEYILTFLKEHKDELHQKYSITDIGLFGSYVAGTATDDSDIDLYANFEKKTFRNIAGAWSFLEASLHKKIDLLHQHKNMRPSLKHSIEDTIAYG